VLVRTPRFLPFTESQTAETRRLAEALARIDDQVKEEDARAATAQSRGEELRRLRAELVAQLRALTDPPESDQDGEAG
jgi:hypothetical protein